jgi:hypothetical protein
MKRLAQILSGLALLGTLLPPCLFFTGQWELSVMQNWMLAAAAMWFLATPLWMEHKATE